MKSYSGILLAICFAAIYSSSALISIEDKAACLKKNGLNSTEKWDLTAQFDYRLEKPFTCYVACVINAIKKPEETVYGKLSEVIERGHVIPASLKKYMENHLDSCYRYNGTKVKHTFNILFVIAKSKTEGVKIERRSTITVKQTS
ncbi:hypothetical protein TSAR_015768 [Trichomalopsis sarcophagae]|uniref:Uncharacterized protein n=1 Tax=Trichomalopsis sarcophagae TaxID=543379 RepID=A0A232EJN3_9HYME|nr:hypothetical protein TSAR_015768 [Trichomalopsis sarcophagae]